jgi:hypothetical protein
MILVIHLDISMFFLGGSVAGASGFAQQALYHLSHSSSPSSFSGIEMIKSTSLFSTRGMIRIWKQMKYGKTKKQFFSSGKKPKV